MCKYIRLLLLTLFIFATSYYSVKNFATYNLIKEYENTCKYYGVECQVKILDTKGTRAYATLDDEIFISRGLIERLTPNELRAVIYHEMSHIILEHPLTSYNYLAKRLKISQASFNELRRGQEFQADELATHLLLIEGRNAELDAALQKIVDRSGWGLSSQTHPSISRRVQHIQRVEEYYHATCNKL